MLIAVVPFDVLRRIFQGAHDGFAAADFRIDRLLFQHISIFYEKKTKRNEETRLFPKSTKFNFNCCNFRHANAVS